VGTPPAGAVFVDPQAGAFTVPDPDSSQDWESKVEAWVKFVATSESSFGPATAVVKVKAVEQSINGTSGPDDTGGLILDEIYVAIGDSTQTIFYGGKKGTINRFDNDEPFNYLGLFNSEKVDAGVKWSGSILEEGGEVLQGQHVFGNGITAYGGLEGLDTSWPTKYAGLAFDNGMSTGNATLGVGGLLSGGPYTWGIHTGITSDLDLFTVRGALAYDSTGYWNVLGSAKTQLDTFNLAGSVEATEGGDWGTGASIEFPPMTVAERFQLVFGYRNFVDGDGIDPSGVQVAAGAKGELTDEIKVSGELGTFANDAGLTLFYGKAGAAWDPGGGFGASLDSELWSNGAYKVKLSANKSFGE
jgi:hypothetical protein